jgi:hypothetical protein
MMGEVSSNDARGNRVPKGAILRRRKRARPDIAPLIGRLRARGEVPASGQIVFRSANQVLR